MHKGFYDCAQSLYNTLQGDLRTLLREKPGYKIVVTGHSMKSLIYYSSVIHPFDSDPCYPLLFSVCFFFLLFFFFFFFFFLLLL